VNLELALRLTEIMMGFAFVQQSLEHLRAYDERIIFLPRLLLATLLIVGFQTNWVSFILLGVGLVILNRFQGPYNGGADRMGLLMLACLCGAHIAPTTQWQEIALGYLAIQLILSYFISGWVKIINPQWRNGQALVDVFHFSSYPVSESLRDWAKSPRLLLIMSWLVIIFELAFPFSMWSTTSLIIALMIAACFHFANACLFGLNRFFWIWLAAYPSIIWFQQRLFDTI